MRLLPWWFSWPIGRCGVCGRLFLRSWPWCCVEEFCSKECNDIEMDAAFGPWCDAQAARAGNQHAASAAGGEE